jgi:hypothetical protein
LTGDHDRLKRRSTGVAVAVAVATTQRSEQKDTEQADAPHFVSSISQP